MMETGKYKSGKLYYKISKDGRQEVYWPNGQLAAKNVGIDNYETYDLKGHLLQRVKDGKLIRGRDDYSGSIIEQLEIAEEYERARRPLPFSNDYGDGLNLFEVRVKKFVDVGGNLNLLDDTGYAMLHHAVVCNNPKALEMLLAYGAKIDVKTSDRGIDKYGHEVLVYNWTNKVIGITPLDLAYRKGHSKCIETLIKNGADLRFTSSDGNNIFHLALRGGDKKTVTSIIKKFGKDKFSLGQLLNSSNKEGLTPLDLTKDPEMIKLLKDNGAEKWKGYFSDKGSTKRSTLRKRFGNPTTSKQEKKGLAALLSLGTEKRNEKAYRLREIRHERDATQKELDAINKKLRSARHQQGD